MASRRSIQLLSTLKRAATVEVGTPVGQNATVPVSQLLQRNAFTTTSMAPDSAHNAPIEKDTIHITDEIYNRQRSQLPLLNRFVVWSHRCAWLVRPGGLADLV